MRDATCELPSLETTYAMVATTSSHQKAVLTTRIVSRA